MTRYKVEGGYSGTDLETLFPQNPDDPNKSIEVLCNDRFSSGWELVSATRQDGTWWFVFKANGRNT